MEQHDHGIDSFCVNPGVWYIWFWQTLWRTDQEGTIPMSQDKVKISILSRSQAEICDFVSFESVKVCEFS